MTVGQLLNTMTAREFGDWVEWYRLRNARAASPVLQSGALDLTTDGGVAALSTMFKK